MYMQKPGLTDTKGEGVCKSCVLLYTQQTQTWKEHDPTYIGVVIGCTVCGSEPMMNGNHHIRVCQLPQRHIFCEVHAGEPPFEWMLLLL